MLRNLFGYCCIDNNSMIDNKSETKILIVYPGINLKYKSTWKAAGNQDEDKLMSRVMAILLLSRQTTRNSMSWAGSLLTTSTVFTSQGTHLSWYSHTMVVSFSYFVGLIKTYVKILEPVHKNCNNSSKLHIILHIIVKSS